MAGPGPGLGSAGGPLVRGAWVELIDALPILAADTPGGELNVWQRAARLALDLVRRGRLVPTLRSSGRGWDARWRVDANDRADRAELTAIGALLTPVLAMPQSAHPHPGASTLTGPRVLYWFLDACADMLVREGCRRTTAVRLGQWPAAAWEQRLVRALGEDRAGFFCEQPAPESLAGELAAWVADQRGAATLSLLPSPAPWQAPESLSNVLRRLVGPAGRLAEALQSGRPAPRTLPLGHGLPIARSQRRAA